MLQANFDTAYYRARFTSNTALPLNIPINSSSALQTADIVVPNNELWQVSYAGLQITFDTWGGPPFPSFTNIVCNIINGPQTIFSADAGNVPIPIPVNTTVGNNSTIYYFFPILSGLVMQKGDRMRWDFSILNPLGSPTAINVTAVNGGVVYLPIRLVSEIAVANLQQSRQDQLLDLRLRASRG